MEDQYRLYTNDSILDFEYEEPISKDPVSFWCHLYNYEEYRILSKLSLLILTICPDSCECERGFSITRHVKNELQTSMTEETLNACMTVAVESRSI